MKYIDLFRLCLVGPWNTDGNETQWKFDKNNNILSFCGSMSKTDWKYNFNFPATIYKDSPVPWMVHRGFVRAWRLVRDALFDYVKTNKNNTKELIITGYSHGAALATLAHEDFLYNGISCKTVTFGAPKILWMPPREIKTRFADLDCVYLHRDLVAHIPFGAWGYTLPPNKTALGGRGLWSAKYHFPEKYIDYLESF